MEQKYGKVIFDPRTEEAKALVGKEVEGANCFNFEHSVTHGKLIMNDGSMTMPDVFPFIIGGYKFTFIRAIEPPKEPSYAERQAKWVAENKVVYGTKVRIARNFIMNENGCIAGSPNECVSKYEMVGKVFPIECIEEKSIRMNGFLFPYFVLEVVNDEYRPFTDGELVDLYGKTLMDEQGLPQMVTGFKHYGGELNVWVGEWLRTSSRLFKEFTLDGHKCGVLV